MKHKKKNIPIGDPQNNAAENICPSASWGDMTGLIPSGTDEDSDIDSYEDVYPFMGGKQ